MHPDKVAALKKKIREKLDRKAEERLSPHQRFIKRMHRLQASLRNSVIVVPDKKIVLSSGRETSIYIDCKPVIYSSDGQYLIGHIINHLIDTQNIKAIGGPATGADPIALATAGFSNFYSQQINAFSIKKETKTHGIERQFFGKVYTGDNVILVDDVLTTGHSLQTIIPLVEKQNLVIKSIIVLVDRQEGGKETLENLGYRVQSLFTKRQLLN